MKRRIRLLFVLAAAFVIVAGGLLTLRRLDRDIAGLESRAQKTRLEELAAEREKGSMLQEINNQDTDSYIMENARNLYGYLMPGEIRFVVINPDVLGITPEAVVVEEGPAEGTP